MIDFSLVKQIEISEGVVVKIELDGEVVWEKPKVYYQVVNNLTGCTNSNDVTSITENTSYNATITANDGYILDGATVSITMGGSDITSIAYSNGVISINAVTGDIFITVTAAEVVNGYTNQVPISIDSSGSVYNGQGWKSATRLSASSGSEKSVTNASLTGFIPVKAGDVVRFKYTGTNQCWDTYSLNTGYNVIAYYNSSFTWLGSICPLQSNSTYGICTATNTSTGSVANGGIVSFTVPSNSNIAYVRLSIAMDTAGDMSLSNLIVTVNQEITE